MGALGNTILSFIETKAMALSAAVWEAAMFDNKLSEAVARDSVLACASCEAGFVIIIYFSRPIFPTLAPVAHSTKNPWLARVVFQTAGAAAFRHWSLCLFASNHFSVFGCVIKK